MLGGCVVGGWELIVVEGKTNCVKFIFHQPQPPTTKQPQTTTQPLNINFVSSSLQLVVCLFCGCWWLSDCVVVGGWENKERGENTVFNNEGIT